ncbi:subclass B1 metallo-beta-lactamase [Pseudobacteriovorax antillogorgiicola]
MLMAIAKTAFSKQETIKLKHNLEIAKIENNVYVATDHEFYQSNSLIIKMQDRSVVVVSSPFENLATEELVNWIKGNLNPKKMIAINPHFHRDGTGGNSVFGKYGIETWSSDLTIDLRKKANMVDPKKAAAFYKDPDLRQRILNSPVKSARNSFPIKEGKEFSFSGETVKVFFPGPAHSPDNVVVYFPRQKILFGGCMIKPASLGYLGDADVRAWPSSAKRLKQFDVKLVVPGHGRWGDASLIDKTISVALMASDASKLNR